jgi:hypothetical protein
MPTLTSKNSIKPRRKRLSREPRVSHPREKYLEKQVARLKAHNHLIGAKQRKKKAEAQLRDILIGLLELQK